jgi:hypothetical protein
VTCIRRFTFPLANLGQFSLPLHPRGCVDLGNKAAEKIRRRLSEKTAPDGGNFDRGMILEFEATVVHIADKTETSSSSILFPTSSSHGVLDRLQLSATQGRTIYKRTLYEVISGITLSLTSPDASHISVWSGIA